MFHAIIFNSHFTDGQQIPLHTRHRTLAAAARSLRTSIGHTIKSGPSWVSWAAVVTPDGQVLSLRQAQGKEPGAITWENLVEGMREVASRPAVKLDKRHRVAKCYRGSVVDVWSHFFCDDVQTAHPTKGIAQTAAEEFERNRLQNL